MEKYVAVDADSIDIQLRNILLRACARTGIGFIFVADRVLKDVLLAKEKGANVQMVCVKTADNSADDYIFSHKDEIFACISHDVGLASRLAENGISTIDKRGNITDCTNYREKKSIRDTNMLLKEDRIFSQKDSKRNKKDTENFANTLDTILRKVKK